MARIKVMDNILIYLDDLNARISDNEKAIELGKNIPGDSVPMPVSESILEALKKEKASIMAEIKING